MNEDSRKSNSIRNFAAGSLNQLVLLLLNLISKSIFIKTLGPVYMGINGLFTNLFLLLSFAEFGIGSVMVYSLYKPISRKDKGQVRRIYLFFRKIYFVLNGIIIIIGIAITPLIPHIVKVDQPLPYVIGYYLLYLLGVVITNIYMYNSHIILADQKKYLLSLYGLLFEGMAMLIQIGILIKSKNYSAYLVVYILKNLLYALAINYKVKSLYPFLKHKEDEQAISPKKKNEIYSKILDVFSYKFARVFITGTDNIVISVIIGTIWVGYYSNYDLIIVGVMSLVDIFYSGISASVGNLVAKEDLTNQYALFETVSLINMWIAGFTATSLYILFQDFISLWLGAQYRLDFGIVILIIINYYLVCNRKSISLFREASGMFNKIKYAVFWGAGLNLFLSISLGKLIGLYGVLLGTIISTLLTYYWYEAKLLLKEKFAVSMMVFVKKQLETLIYTCLSIGLVSLAVGWINQVTVGFFALKLLICLVVSNGFYLIILSRKKGFKGVLDIGIRPYEKLRRR